MSKKLCVFLLILAMVSVANGKRYQGSGPWENPAGWIPPGLPGPDDPVRINWADNTVTVSSAVPTCLGIQAGLDEPGTLHILNGGTVQTGSSWTGAGVAGACLGTINVDAGGTLNTGVIVPGGGHLWVGMNDTGVAGNVGLVNISGTVNVGGIIGLGTLNAVTPSGGLGFVNVLDGGLLALSNIAPVTSIQPGSLLDISGTGQVTLPGDFEAVIAAYAAAGKIAGNGVPGAVQTDLTTNPGFTTVMVPEPATMSLLALGAIALLRKKK